MSKTTYPALKAEDYQQVMEELCEIAEMEDYGGVIQGTIYEPEYNLCSAIAKHLENPTDKTFSASKKAFAEYQQESSVGKEDVLKREDFQRERTANLNEWDKKI